MKKIGINGFGRIGRTFARFALLDNSIEIALINDLTDIKTLAHLLKYDSIHGELKLKFEIVENSLHFENGKIIHFSQEKDPTNIPWEKHSVHTVIEATGIFLTAEKAALHLQSGAKKVILSAPAKDNTKTIVLGVNDHTITKEDWVISNASCTTNCASPMYEVIKKLANVELAFLSTIHSYTSDQRLHDSPHSDLRRARSAATSIIPTSTGAAQAMTKIFPELVGKMEGSSFRVPVSDGSITELTLLLDKELTVSEINEAFKKASQTEMKGIIRYTDEPLVSIDIVGDPHSVIFDSELTSTIGKMVKLVGWYDNESGYSMRLLDLVHKLS